MPLLNSFSDFFFFQEKKQFWLKEDYTFIAKKNIAKAKLKKKNFSFFTIS